MDPRLHLLGIRHHGPGCAASLEQALAQIKPAAVLIEGPPEANHLIPHAAAPGMRPPLAILSYPAASPEQARFHPFAEFSPEWRALRWALAHERMVAFIDAPPQMPKELVSAAAQESEAAQAPVESVKIARDPLEQLAAAAGHSDGEAWWNSLVEQHAHAPEIFTAIESAMTALREVHEETACTDTPERRRELQREAYMRIAIRRALKEHTGEVAVVCGAWHVPVRCARRPRKVPTGHWSKVSGRSRQRPAGYPGPTKDWPTPAAMAPASFPPAGTGICGETSSPASNRRWWWRSGRHVHHGCCATRVCPPTPPRSLRPAG